jgi:hypothetical protein
MPASTVVPTAGTPPQATMQSRSAAQSASPKQAMVF